MKVAPIVRVVVLGIGLCVVAPASASAQGESSEPIEYMALAVPVGLSGMVFVTVDIVYAVQGELLPTGWAIGQVINAAAELAFGAAGMILFADGSGENLTLTLGIIGLATGTWHVAHSIWSWVSGGPSPDYQVSAVPIEGGGLLSVSGRL